MVEKKVLLTFAGITSSIIALDQFVKWLVLTTKPQFNILFLRITYVENTGAGFSILQGNALLLGLFSALVGLLIIIFYKKFSEDLKLQIPLALFLAGTLGNMIDRIFRGFVIDFVGTSWWPYFNIADASLNIAIFLLIAFSIFDKKFEIFKEKK